MYTCEYCRKELKSSSKSVIKAHQKTAKCLKTQQDQKFVDYLNGESDEPTPIPEVLTDENPESLSLIKCNKCNTKCRTIDEIAAHQEACLDFKVQCLQKHLSYLHQLLQIHCQHLYNTAEIFRELSCLTDF